MSRNEKRKIEVGRRACLRELRSGDSENTPLFSERGQYQILRRLMRKKPFVGGAGMVPHWRGEESEA
jgi:hypothetical protein